ncbi:MAG: FAD-dependent oxidoreductase [Clostridia bacterium]|nr:FAD-dependent oxidoreductase [Clostridia bacterium]
MFDVAIIGAGVVGCAVAYELSQYELRVALIEKENDVAMGASRANTAIIHGGYDPEPHTLMGKLNVEGMHRCFELCEKLDVEHKKTGSWVVAFDEEQHGTLQVLLEQGIANGCEGLEILEGNVVRLREPNLSDDIVSALWVPESGVLNPWEFTLAMAEVAVRNGVTFMPITEVTALSWREDHYEIGICIVGAWHSAADEDVAKKNTCLSSLPKEKVVMPDCRAMKISARYVINAAGVESDRIHNMVAPPAFEIVPTRGEYYLLDGTTAGHVVGSVIFPCPTRAGKGITVSPTIHGDYLVGPNAEVIADRSDTSVTRSALLDIAEKARRVVPNLDLRTSIRNFAGVRSNSTYGDFFIEKSATNFIDLAAIKSPGLTCAPAIARVAREMLREEGLPMERRTLWRGGRRVIRFKEIPEEERAAFVREHPLYGRVICRCETITEGEIVAAMKREIPPVSIDGVKRRAGTGMGRCQGGFCGPRVLEIIARESGRDPLCIEEDGCGSVILIGETKDPRYREV